MRLYEIFEARENPTTIYDNGRGETIHIEDRGPKYRLMGVDHRYYGWTNRYDMDWDTKDEMMAWLDEKGFRVVGWEGVEEGEVIDTKFQQRLAQKRGMFHNPDAEPPVSMKDGQPFDRFETQDTGSGKSAHIIGVRADGYAEVVGTSEMRLAIALASAYNAGGYSTQKIEKVPLGDYFK